MSYNHQQIEKKWQDKWESSAIFHSKRDHKKTKFYALSMFPYPSGAGLHIGHLASYIPTEVLARFKRAKGFNVLHPMGYDAFGLPAEQYAIQTGIHPEKVTQKAIENFRRQLKSFGFSFDWKREISTCNPSYYKWTQYIFKILYRRKLAYQDRIAVNWCPALRTVLANEEVLEGKSERGGHKVIRVPKKQWMLKITQYCENLIKDLDNIDWPESTKAAQKNWIGKSEGVLIEFPIKGIKETLKVWTTRPDTLFGVSYMVLAPEHPLVQKITRKEQGQAVKTYQKKCLLKSEVQRKSNQNKTGVWTGAYAKHPITNEDLPLWISDYVLMDYGAGAIMAVPAHEERDYDFASKFNLKIIPVIKSDKLPFEGDGVHINSEHKEVKLNGLNQTKACERIISYLEKTKKGKKQIQYKLRDWLFSRQRYWGEPFPVVTDKTGNHFTVPDEELPVLLPPVVDYEPTEKGEPPLARIQSFVNYKNKGQRETDTMPGSAASSWYFLRYTDPQNDKAPFDFEEQKYWMPVDLYVGGSEHSVGHLLYSRFWQKVLFDEGLVSHKEPFKKLVHQGVILGEDGYRMSKSRGNGVNPDELREKYGADCLRLYICFLGPVDKDKPWSSKGIEGVRRFLNRFYRFATESKSKNQELPNSLNSLVHQTIKKVTEDIENLDLNTAISSLMILLNEIYRLNVKNKELAKTFSQLLQPFAPHLAEEIWKYLEEKSFISLTPWPDYDVKTIKKESFCIGVQINGRTRGSIELFSDDTQEIALKKALKLKAIQNIVQEREIKKCIYKQGRILNIIV